MRCRTARRYLLISAEGGTGSAQVTAHAAVCPACRAYAASLAHLRHSAAGIDPQTVPDGFTDRLLVRLRETPKREVQLVPERSRAIAWRWLPVPIALALVAAGGIYLGSGHRTKMRSGPTIPPVAIAPQAAQLPLPPRAVAPDKPSAAENKAELPAPPQRQLASSRLEESPPTQISERSAPDLSGMIPDGFWFISARDQKNYLMPGVDLNARRLREAQPVYVLPVVATERYVYRDY